MSAAVCRISDDDRLSLRLGPGIMTLRSKFTNLKSVGKELSNVIFVDALYSSVGKTSPISIMRYGISMIG
jgi:hypothetical protein